MPTNLVVFSATVKSYVVAEVSLPNSQPCAIYALMDLGREFVEWVRRQLVGANMADKVLCEPLNLDKDEVSRRMSHQRGWTLEQMNRAAEFFGTDLAKVMDELLKRRPSAPVIRSEWAALLPTDPEEAETLVKTVRMIRRDIPKRRAPRRKSPSAS